MYKVLHCVLHLLVITNTIQCDHYRDNGYQKGSASEPGYHHKERSSEPYCPNYEDISPCSCISDYAGLVLDCSSVEDDEDLARVFRVPFPTSDVYKLTIEHNNHITNLSDNTFGDITFEEVHIKFCEVQFVGMNTFVKSAETLKKLDLQHNLLPEFPFDVLDEFIILKSLVLNNNKFTYVPIINVPTLEYFALHTNPLTEVPENPFRNMPNLETLYLSNAKLTSLPTDMFTHQSNLILVDFSLNQLTTLDENTFALVSDKMNFLYLMDNNISILQPGTFSGFAMRNILIDFSRNSLTTLEEPVFGDLLHNKVQIRLSSNPLICGCDVAWIVRDPDLHYLVGTARCVDGQRVVDLDTSNFVECP